MNAAQLLPPAVQRLRAAGVADPMGDARRLLAFALDVAPGRLTLLLYDPVPDGAADRFEAAIFARENHQPVAQIIGHRLFYGREFLVTSDVLDPRPETEISVLAALARPANRILDMGTGSGCLLFSLLAEWPEACGVATDISAPALAVARENAERLGLRDRAAFQQCSWAEDVEGQFDLILSNPPYISAAEMQDLAPDVLKWEPDLALSPGGDGLDAYRALIPQAAHHLEPQGRLILEIGPSQAAAVIELGQAAGLVHIGLHKDLDGRDRSLEFSQL
ncbi:MAG: peptide chain release factor N(5)-glutamine methyltransferase [Mangrovicoccus sp.]